MKPLLIKLFSTLVVVFALFLFLGLMGAVHPAGDTAAVFRGYFGFGLLALGGLLAELGKRRWGAGGVGLGALAVLSMGLLPLGPRVNMPAPQDTAISHYQKNLQYHNDHPAELLADILARDPDVVTLQEVAGRSAGMVPNLAATYPTAHWCKGSDSFGVAVFARWEPVAGTGFCIGQVAGVQVAAPNGPLWVLSTHLRWVYPYPNAAQVAALEPHLRALDGPVVVGGDFNVVPWAASVRRFARATGTERLGPAFVTYETLGGLLRVQIDHVLVPGGQGRVWRLEKLGSDHWGIWAQYTLPVSE